MTMTVKKKSELIEEEVEKIINVFIVDDDIFVLELYKKICGILGLNIIDIAKDGEEAVSKFRKFITKPDLIVMDYHMPCKNGLEATQAILEIDETAKIVIVSGDSTIKQKALTSGAICFKKKSFNLIKLKKQLNFFKNKACVGKELYKIKTS